LFDKSDKVIGIDTAASASRYSSTQGYAIPIAKALSIAAQIDSGKETSTIHIGYPAFLGVSLSGTAVGGVGVTGVVSGSAAANAGIAAGATITAVNGTAVTAASGLSAAISSHQPGDKVSVSWVDSSGTSHTATVTLGSGPAD
jgi:S1-C subfamily serine protease